MSISIVPNRHARMLRIFRQLQSGGGLNATDLAMQLDVCRRTIFRDLETIRRAGVEFYYDEELDGYRLAAQEAVALPTLGHDELTLLVAAVHLSVLGQLPEYACALRRAVGKLLATSPQQVQHHVRRVVKACCLQRGETNDSAPSQRVVHHLFAAISQRKTLRVTVASPDGEDDVVTRFAPYLVTAALDAWQVTGRSSHHRGVRTFDPRQFKRLEITNEIYAVPRRF